MVEWKKFRDTDYYVSNTGLIKRDVGQCAKGLIKPFVGARYKTVSLSVNGVKKTEFVHAMVAECFIGPRPRTKTTNHKDGVRHNNHINNLEYVTQKENIRHSLETGLRKFKKYCPEGHANEKRNAPGKYWNGWAVCYVCVAKKAHARYYKNRERTNVKHGRGPK